MSIQITSTTNNNAAVSMARQAGRDRPKGPDPEKLMAPVADTLGMTTTELRTAMESGSTLQQLATSKGISHTDLVAAVKAGLEAARPDGASATGATSASAGTAATGKVFDLDALAESIASGQRPEGPQGMPPSQQVHGRNSNDQQSLDKLSSLLDMSSDDLVSALRNGTSLSDLASQHGVDANRLLDVLSSGMVMDTRV
jgi:hypothetical protein